MASEVINFNKGSFQGLPLWPNKWQDRLSSSLCSSWFAIEGFLKLKACKKGQAIIQGTTKRICVLLRMRTASSRLETKPKRSDFRSRLFEEHPETFCRNIVYTQYSLNNSLKQENTAETGVTPHLQ